MPTSRSRRAGTAEAECDGKLITYTSCERHSRPAAHSSLRRNMPNVVRYRKVSSRHAAPQYTVAVSSRLTLSAPAAMDGSSETDFDPAVPLARASLDSPGGEGAGGRLAGLEDAFFLGGTSGSNLPRSSGESLPARTFAVAAAVPRHSPGCLGTKLRLFALAGDFEIRHSAARV